LNAYNLTQRNEQGKITESDTTRSLPFVRYD